MIFVDKHKLSELSVYRILKNQPLFWIRIRIHKIYMFFCIQDPDPLDRCMDPDPDPPIIKQK